MHILEGFLRKRSLTWAKSNRILPNDSRDDNNNNNKKLNKHAKKSQLAYKVLTTKNTGPIHTYTPKKVDWTYPRRATIRRRWQSKIVPTHRTRPSEQAYGQSSKWQSRVPPTCGRQCCCRRGRSAWQLGRTWWHKCRPFVWSDCRSYSHITSHIHPSTVVN